MGIIEQILKARTEFWFSLQRQLRGPALTQRVRYALQPHIVKSAKPIPLFGSDPEIADYAQTRSFAPQAVGAKPGVSRPIINRSGSLANLSAAHLDERAHEDQNISRSFSRTSESTDQQPVRQRVSMGEVWDGVVRNAKTNSGIQGVRNVHGRTAQDQHTEDLKHYAYDFSG